MAKNKKYNDGGVVGVFDYEKKSKKKKSNKDILKKIRKKAEKKIIKQSKCNHIAKNTGKSYFKKVEDREVETVRCEICGAEIIVDEKFLTEDIIKTSVQVLSSIYSIYRNKFNLSAESNAKISNAIIANAKCLDMFQLMKKRSLDDSKKLRDKKKKKKGKKYKKSGNKIGRAYSSRRW